MFQTFNHIHYKLKPFAEFFGPTFIYLVYGRSRGNPFRKQMRHFTYSILIVTCTLRKSRIKGAQINKNENKTFPLIRDAFDFFPNKFCHRNKFSGCFGCIETVVLRPLYVQSLKSRTCMGVGLIHIGTHSRSLHG